jgi:predicted thioredoxin/glutaredoxin
VEVLIVATKSCAHCPLLDRQLTAMGIEHEIKYIEDNPDLQQQFGITTSPNIIVDGALVLSGMPELSKLKDVLEELRTKQDEPPR